MTSLKILFIIGLALADFIVSLLIVRYSIRFNDDISHAFELKKTDDTSYYHFQVASDTLAKATMTNKNVKVEDIKPTVAKVGRAKFLFNSNPILLVWMLVFSMMLGTATGLLLPVCGWIKNLYVTFKPNVMAIVLLIIVILVIITGGEFLQTPDFVNLLTAFEITRCFKILFLCTTGLNVIIRVTMLIGGATVLGMFVINACIPKIEDAAQNDSKKIVELYELLRQGLKFFLTVLSVLIVYSIFTSSLFQQTLNNSIVIKGLDNFTLFPSEFIYAYGLLFTIILAIIYLPIDYHLRYHGKKMAALIQQAMPTDEAQLKTAEKEIKILESQDSGLKSLNIFLTILSPILGSAFSEIIKHISE